MTVNYIRLSRTISHALRHQPWAYGLELDKDGWVSISSLVFALKRKSYWQHLTADDLHEMMRRSGKCRHEIRDGRIRALYGHSTPDHLSRLAKCPPELLYHGTDRKAAEAILAEGLKAMARQYAHLSADYETALRVGSRKSAGPMVLLVRAGQAHQQGVTFYEGNESVWLADYVPPAFISLMSVPGGGTTVQSALSRESAASQQGGGASPAPETETETR